MEYMGLGVPVIRPRRCPGKADDHEGREKYKECGDKALFVVAVFSHDENSFRTYQSGRTSIRKSSKE